MKIDQVPQDKGAPNKNTFRSLCYATDEKGNYTTLQSEGWEPKIIALDLSIQTIAERTAHALSLVSTNKASPVLYFMEKNKMDIAILSASTGLWKWQIKRHLKPAVFNKLNHKILKRYADAFHVTVVELTELEGK